MFLEQSYRSREFSIIISVIHMKYVNVGDNIPRIIAYKVNKGYWVQTIREP